MAELGLGIALLWMWATLILALRVDWSVNPQYAYGWAVPVLCVTLYYRHRQAVVAGDCSAADARGEVAPSWSMVGIVVMLSAWPAIRLIQQANPDWRLVAWAQALEVCGVTYGWLRLALGVGPPLFPIAFFLVAIPWPSCIELPLIHWLTRLNTELTVALAGWLGVPALAHGNVIEVSTGLIGIEEPCSGIRSLQASLMVALFLGAYFRLGWSRHLLLLAAGLGLALAGNLARTCLLTLMASWRGIEFVYPWHDPGGAAILVGCFFLLSLVARTWSKKFNRAEARRSSPGPSWSLSASSMSSRHPYPSLAILGVFMPLWLVLSEVGVEAYYRFHEASLPKRQFWTVRPPAEISTLTQTNLPEKVQSLLRYSRAAHFAWEEDAVRWQVIFLEWTPGRVTSQLARFHNPEVCLSATGQPHEVVSDLRFYAVGDLHLPFRILRVPGTAGVQYLFYCIWEDRAGTQAAVADTLDYWSRLRQAFQGRRNLGQRALAIRLQGVADCETAEALLAPQLRRLVVPKRD